MKIAYFSDTYKPQINGVVTSIENFKDELKKRGHDVHLFVPKAPDFNPKDKKIHTFTSSEFKKYAGYRVSVPLRLINFDFSDFDIVHAQTPATMGVAAKIISKRRKLPFFATYHTSLDEYAHYLTNIKFFKKLTEKAIWTFTRKYYNATDSVLVPTEKIKKKLKKNGIKRKIDVIPTGVKIKKLKKSKNQLKQKYTLENSQVVLHVGRVTKEKNIDTVIKAFEKLDKNYKLIITSDGPYKKKLEEKTKQNKNIIFTGYLSDKELKEYYKLSDVFVMASETETQGLVLLEALIGENPLVVLDAPVIGDFVKKEDVGYVCSEAKQMAGAIKKAIKNDKFKEQRKRTLDKYNIKKCTDKLVSVYEEQK